MMATEEASYWQAAAASHEEAADRAIQERDRAIRALRRLMEHYDVAVNCAHGEGLLAHGEWQDAVDAGEQADAILEEYAYIAEEDNE